MINQLYHTWIKQIQQLRPKERITRVRTLAWMMMGMFQSKSVHLSKIAVKIPGKAKTLSIDRRLRRFVNNDAVDALEWYQPVAQTWIAWQAQSTGQIRLIMDGTKIGCGYQLLIVALAFRRRAVPIAWRWVKKKQSKGHSSTEVHLELLRSIYHLIPNHLSVLVVGDTEFGRVELMRQLEQWGWQYVLRLREYFRLREPHQTQWVHPTELLTKPGQSRWMGHIALFEKHAHPTHIGAYWKMGEERPWFLATNLPALQPTLRSYRRRAWIEEMFGDWKGHGVDVERTRLLHPQRLSRLILAVVLLFNWLLTLGVQTIRNGNRPYVDRTDRRDLSVFQIGLRFLDRALTNDLPVAVRLCPC